MKYALPALLLSLAACSGNISTQTISNSTASNKDGAIPATADSVLAGKQENSAGTVNTRSKLFSTSENNVVAEDKYVIESFVQSGEGRNYASISVIKLAIRKYGLAHVFSKVDSTATGFNVTLQDGKSIFLSREELKEVNKFSDFRLAEGFNI